MAGPETLQRGVASRMRELTRAAAAIDDPSTANRAIDDGPPRISAVIPALRPRGPGTSRGPRTRGPAAPAAEQARTEPPPAATPAPTAPPAQPPDEIWQRLPSAAVAPAPVTNYRATVNRALDPYPAVEPRYQRIMNEALGVFVRHLNDYDFDFGPPAEVEAEAVARERESGGAKGAGPGGDPDVANRKAWARRRAAAAKVLGPLVGLLEDEMGRPLYTPIEADNGFTYMIGEDALGALGYSDKSVQELDRVLRYFDMAPQGEGTHLFYNQVAPGLQPYTFRGTEKENERDLAERREELRKERLDTAIDAILSMGPGLGRAGARYVRGSRPPRRSLPARRRASTLARAARREPTPYIQNNPSATKNERRIGEALHREAQSGRLPGVMAVEGAPEARPQERGNARARSGDYRFVMTDGRRISADLYEPTTGDPSKIAGQMRSEKSGQAAIVVIRLRGGGTRGIDENAAEAMAREIVDTPGHTIERVIVIQLGEVLVDVRRR